MKRKGDIILIIKGTRIIILNPEGVPPIDELAKYIKRYFGLRIAKGAEIILNGTKLKVKMDTEENLLFKIGKNGIVTGNLEVSDTMVGFVDLYVQHVYICQVLVDPNRLFTGWLNYDELTPTTSRQELKRDEAYQSLMDSLKTYITRFPKKEESLTHADDLLTRSFSNLLKAYMKDHNLYLEGKIAVGKGNEDSKNKLGEKTKDGQESETKESEKQVPEYSKVHASSSTYQNTKRTLKTDYGIAIQEGNYGADKEPVFFLPPNNVFINHSNEITKFAYLNPNGFRGSKNIRLLPYMARVSIDMNPESGKLLVQRSRQGDRRSNKVLSQKVGSALAGLISLSFFSAFYLYLSPGPILRLWFDPKNDKADAKYPG